ncbi:UxaA family hydrolase [Candidatus Bipolaricaulota bacterium]|nr:UxaA family hydrolase [Candidatus Bipolaricaulota bacterium]
MEFQGYRRKSGKVGIRNHVLVFPTVVCSAEVARMISEKVPGTVYAIHGGGCGHIGEEKDKVIRTMLGICAHGNVASVLLVANGCEVVQPELLTVELDKLGQPYDVVSVQEDGGTPGCIEKGTKIAAKMVEDAAKLKKESIPMSELMLGCECGGSDAFSGLTANPSLGIAADKLIAEGGTAIFSETTEMLGCEHVLAKRALNDKVAKDIYDAIDKAEIRAMRGGVDIRGAQPSPGNQKGGLSSIEEKSLGCIRKGGKSTITQVVKYGETPVQKGCIIMDATAADVMNDTALLAAGCHVIVFTTGRGTPVGSPIGPVIKVSTNSVLYGKMKPNIDVNAGSIVDGEGTLESVGQEIFDKIVACANGEQSKAEALGHREFDIHFDMDV